MFLNQECVRLSTLKRGRTPRELFKYYSTFFFGGGGPQTPLPLPALAFECWYEKTKKEA